jgi:hypothetical protein
LLRCLTVQKVLSDQELSMRRQSDHSAPKDHSVQLRLLRQQLRPRQQLLLLRSVRLVREDPPRLLRRSAQLDQEASMLRHSDRSAQRRPLYHLVQSDRESLMLRQSDRLVQKVQTDQLRPSHPLRQRLLPLHSVRLVRGDRPRPPRRSVQLDQELLTPRHSGQLAQRLLPCHSVRLDRELSMLRQSDRSVLKAQLHPSRRPLQQLLPLRSVLSGRRHRVRLLYHSAQSGQELSMLRHSDRSVQRHLLLH